MQTTSPTPVTQLLWLPRQAKQITFQDLTKENLVEGVVRGFKGQVLA